MYVQPFDTPFTLQAIHPAVIGIGQNAPALQLPSDTHMRTCHTVACAIPFLTYNTEVLKCLKYPPINLEP